MKFCTVIDHQSVSSNMKKIAEILRPLSFVQRNTRHKTKNMKNTINSFINGNITVKFCTGSAQDKTILRTK